jgi:hypothetical protein
MLAFKSFAEPLLQVTEVNIFFFTLFSRAQAAELRFKVDGWNSETHVLESKATRVTRLERMVRGTHAFVVIYPFQGISGASCSTRAQNMTDGVRLRVFH